MSYGTVYNAKDNALRMIANAIEAEAAGDLDMAATHTENLAHIIEGDSTLFFYGIDKRAWNRASLARKAELLSAAKHI